MEQTAVYIVLCDGLLVLGAYRNANLAQTHARIVTGASVVAVMISDVLPESVYIHLGEDFGSPVTPVSVPVIYDIAFNEFDEDQDTPVTETPI